MSCYYIRDLLAVLTHEKDTRKSVSLVGYFYLEQVRGKKEHRAAIHYISFYNIDTFCINLLVKLFIYPRVFTPFSDCKQAISNK